MASSAPLEPAGASRPSGGIELSPLDASTGAAATGGGGAATAEEAGKTALHAEGSESSLSAGLQILFPFLAAGLGMVGAGLLLDRVMQWDVFCDIRELCILVPPLLGMKGNLEMTLASRLSSHAALGDLDSRSSGLPLVVANLALIQCQGIVLGFLASGVAALMSQAASDGLNYDDFLLVCASAISTASVASLLIGLLMALVVTEARRFGCNPDNVAAPVAAALGDLVTLGLLANFSEVFWHAEGSGLASNLIGFYVVVALLCALRVLKCPHTAPVLYTGWGPIICSMCISSVGGMVLDKASEAFPSMPVFQPVMNGAGGNLAAVQASRMATHLHERSRPGDLKEDADTQRGVVPWSVFLGRSRHAQTARVLMFLVVPGHVVFLTVTCATKDHDSSLGMVFFSLYMLGALLQEWFLLYACVHLVHFQWRMGIDPDNAAVPFLTAMGDLCGSTLLAGAFAASGPQTLMQTLAAQPPRGHEAALPSRAFALAGGRVGLRPALALHASRAPGPPSRAFGLQLPAVAAAFAAARALASPLRSSARRAWHRR